MSKNYWKKTLEHYTDTHKQYPGEAKGLGWSKASQKIRFKVMVEAIKDRNLDDSILDVGCGYGDLSQYTEWASHYHGIDLNQHMIEEASRRYPSLEFSIANLEELERTYDWVLASGPFNLKAEDNQKIIQEAIQDMWKLCKKGVVFNILVEGSKITNDVMHFYDPGRVLNYCRTVTPKVVCYVDYLPHDATFGLYR